MSTSCTTKALKIGLLLLIAFWVSILYWPGLHGPYFLDDLQTIDLKQPKELNWSELLSKSLQNHTGPVGRPISVLSLSLNYVLLGGEPFYFKLINLILHVVTGFSIGWFVYLLILSLYPSKLKKAKLVAMFCAIIWLIHPLQVSTVLYAVQRMTQLSALFTLLGLISYLYGRLTHKKYFYLGSLIFFPLAILSKETGFLFVFYLFLIEYFILNFQCQNPKNRYYLIHFYRIACLLCILFSLIYFYSHLNKYFSIYHEKDLTLFSRLMTEAKVIVFYIALILRPTLSNMGLYHDDFPLSTTLDLPFILSLSVLLLMLLTIFIFKRRAPILAFGLAWFLVSHLIEATFIPLELVFEHRNYLAMLGPILIINYYFIRFWNRTNKKMKIISSIFYASLIIMLSFLTLIRSVNWSNSQFFIDEAYIYHPKSPSIHIEMGNWLLNKQDYPRAINEFDIALQLQPNNVGLYLHKILTGCKTQHVSDDWYQSAENNISKFAITPYVIVTLDYIVYSKFTHTCPAVDITKIERIINRALENPYLKYRLRYKATLYRLLAGVMLLQNNVEQCLMDLQKAFQIYPKNIDPLIEKATIEWKHRLYDDSIQTRQLISEQVTILNNAPQKLYELDILMQSKEKL